MASKSSFGRVGTFLCLQKHHQTLKVKVHSEVPNSGHWGCSVGLIWQLGQVQGQDGLRNKPKVNAGIPPWQGEGIQQPTSVGP